MPEHLVKATMTNHELAKTGSGITLEIYENDSGQKKLGTLLIGQGSMQWISAWAKSHSQRIDWTVFAQKMAKNEWSGWTETY